MYDIKDIRRENVRALAKLVGGITYLANKLSKSQSQISQLIGKSPSKNIGDRIARQIETMFGKPRGWMDIPHNHVEETITAYELVKNTAPHRPIPLLEFTQTEQVTSIKELSQQANHKYLIPGNAKLGTHAFALHLSDIDAQKCSPFTFPKHTIVIADPDKNIYNGAFIVIRHPQNRKFSLRQVSVDGKKVHLKVDGNHYTEEPLTSDTHYAVIREVVVEFE